MWTKHVLRKLVLFKVHSPSPSKQYISGEYLNWIRGKRGPHWEEVFVRKQNLAGGIRFRFFHFSDKFSRLYSNILRVFFNNTRSPLPRRSLLSVLGILGQPGTVGLIELLHSSLLEALSRNQALKVYWNHCTVTRHCRSNWTITQLPDTLGLLEALSSN